MIQLFKKANSAAKSEDAGEGKQKWNADEAFVKVDNEYVPLSELAKMAKENDYISLQSVENEMEIDGATHNVSDLISRYKASKKNADDNSDAGDEALQAGKKGMKGNEVAGAVEDNKDEALEKAKKNEDEGDKEVEKGEEKGSEKLTVKKQAKKNDDEMDEKEMKDNDVDEDEDIKDKISKDNSKNKDVRHFIRLNTARENASGDVAGSVLTIDTQHNRVNRGKDRYGSNK